MWSLSTSHKEANAIQCYEILWLSAIVLNGRLCSLGTMHKPIQVAAEQWLSACSFFLIHNMARSILLHRMTNWQHVGSKTLTYKPNVQ